MTSTTLKWRASEPIQRFGWGGGKRIWYQTETELGEITCDDASSSPSRQGAAKVWHRDRGAVEFLGYWTSGHFAFFTPGGTVSLRNAAGEKLSETSLRGDLELVESRGGGIRIGCLMVSRQGGELDPGIPLYEWIELDSSLKEIIRIPLSESISPYAWEWDEVQDHLWAGRRREDAEWRRFDGKTGKELNSIRWKVSPFRKEWVLDVKKVRNGDRTAVIEQRPDLLDYRVGVVEKMGFWPTEWTRIGSSRGEYLHAAWNPKGDWLAVLWQHSGYCLWEWYRCRDGRIEAHARKGRSEPNHKGFWTEDYWVYVGEENEIFLESCKELEF